MKNKLIIHLSKPIIELPDSKSKYSLDAIKVTDDSLKKAFKKIIFHKIKNTVPSFKMGNNSKKVSKNKFFQISDLSLIYTLSFNTEIGKLKEYKDALSKLDNVKMVEYVYKYDSTDETVMPDDEKFRYTDNNSNGVYDFGTDTPGRQWGLFDYYVSNSQDRADVSMPEAWDYTTGSADIKIGFVEDRSSCLAGGANGITELKGRHSGPLSYGTGDLSHVIATTGIAVANTDNDHLVAGVDWNAKYYSARHDADSEELAAAIYSCINENCNIINNSWCIEAGEDGSYSTMLAIRNAYFSGALVVAAMGNNYGSQDRAPACYSDIVFSVASSNKSNNYSSFSSHNSYVDVTAPGGTNSTSQYDDICVITGDDDVDYVYGTSFSAPLVSGVASLMMSMRDDVRAEDVENILIHTANDVYPTGFDNYTGWGKINAYEAVRRLSSEYNMERHTTTGGTIIQVDNDWKTFSLYASLYTCLAKKYRIEKNVSFDSYYQGTPLVWGNIDGTLGVPPSNPNYQIPWCGAKDGTVTSSGATIQTFVYKCIDIGTLETFWYPCAPSDVEFAYTVLGIDAPPQSPQNFIYDEPDANGHPKFTWNANSEPDLAGYNIYKKEMGVDWIKHNSSLITGTQYTDYDVIANPQGGIAIHYYVTAVDNSQLESDPSDYAIVGTGRFFKQGGEGWIAEDIPDEYKLLNAYPNPFNPATTIRFGLPVAGSVLIQVYSINGQLVSTLVDKYLEAGYHKVSFNGHQLSSGIYIYKISTDKFTAVKRMLLVK